MMVDVVQILSCTNDSVDSFSLIRIVITTDYNSGHWSGGQGANLQVAL